jgi:hypothetical protein
MTRPSLGIVCGQVYAIKGMYIQRHTQQFVIWCKSQLIRQDLLTGVFSGSQPQSKWPGSTNEG